ncbi:uncharacterized protein [Dendrobates tinctorius]|uniref:uncharacterized protein n=1 Tax=Dendrobates tinctorius TaxID=92724 RepID=UPI003CC9F56C
MDYKASEQAWLGKINQVFNNGANAQCNTIQRNVDFGNSIKQILSNRTRLWWNKTFLENYIIKQIIPRGLRIKVIPSYPVDDETFIKNWEELCNNTSKRFMEMLIESNNKTLVDLDNKLHDLLKQAKSELSVEHFQEMNIQIDKHIELLVKNIQESQTTKYNRDSRDFQTNNVYRWRKHRVDFKNQRNPSVSSGTSMSDVSANSSASFNMMTRFGARPKRNREQRHFSFKRRNEESPNKGKRDMKVINLSTHVLSETDLCVLSKGLSFSPKTDFQLFTVIKDLHIFARALIYKKYFHDQTLCNMFPTEKEQEALRNLEELAEEHNILESDIIPASIKPKSKKFPALSTCPNVDLFVKLVSKDLESIPRYAKMDNLSGRENSTPLRTVPGRLWWLQHAMLIVKRSSN